MVMKRSLSPGLEQGAGQRSKFLKPNKAVDGIITRIYLKNFMCHGEFEW